MITSVLGLSSIADAQSGIGACCRTAGCVAPVASTQCQGGTFLDGQTCAACDQAGACCVNATCAIFTPAQCAAAAGTFMGGSCAPTPCPNTTTNGACCNPQTGACFIGPQTQCPSPPNFWYPGLTACSPVPCAHLGACCNPATGGCTQTVQTACNGNWYANTPCTAAGVCSPPGACCITASGACVNSTAANCPTTVGTFFANITCSTVPCQPHGACCYLNPTNNALQCISTTSAECTSLGGSFIVNGSCTPNPCPNVPRGACCIPGTAGNCVFVLQTQCPSGATFTPGVPCNAVPPPCPNAQGACCTATAGCIIVPNGQCPTGSLYLPGQPCVPNPCPHTGACCTAAGCTYTSLANCAGVFYPNMGCGVSPCNNSGSCCTADGNCVVTPATQCGGLWTANMPCTPNPCPRGGCCNPDTGFCVITTLAQCHAHNLVWLGNGVPCTPNNCMPRRGACCRPGSSFCVISTASQCPGVWHANHPCQPNPCCPPNWTGSGVISVQDIFDFLAAWFAGCP